MPPIRSYHPYDLPDVMRAHSRRAQVRAVRERSPAGYEMTVVGPGAIAPVLATGDRFDRELDLHMATAVAASRRTRVPHALSDLTAAACHGLNVWRLPKPPTLVSARKASSLDANGYKRRQGELPPEDIVWIGDIPCTTVERTAVDCARFLPPLDALVVVDQVLAVLGQADRFHRERSQRDAEAVRQRLLARLGSLPARARGVQRARSIITWASPWADSPPETAVRHLVLLWGRRDVIPQLEVQTKAGRFFTDLSLPDGTRPDGTQRWVHTEYDGFGKYQKRSDGSTSAMLRERDRERALLELGDSVVRLDRRNLRRPDRILAELNENLTSGDNHPLHPVAELRAPQQRKRTA